MALAFLNDRRRIVENWLWWATFVCRVNAGASYHVAGVAARDALTALWAGK